MDLAYGEEYETFREEVRAFLAKHGKQAPPQFARGKSDAKARAWQQLLIEHGYAARTIPREYGGYGAEPDILKSHIIAEEFAKARVRPGHIGDDRLVPTLLELGTEEQKRAYIEPTVRGEMRWCQGYSEPNSGSDLASLSTRAELDGDEFVINGQKIWTSGAQHADMIFCLVRTEPDAPKHQGISYLPVFDGYTGHRGAPAGDNDGRGHVQRGVPSPTCVSRQTRSSDAGAKAGTSRTPP